MTRNWKLIIPTIFIALFFIQCKEKFPHGDPDNGGLFLPKGFEAEVVVDSLKGAARHLAVNSNGDIYVKTRIVKGHQGVIAALRDKDNDGKADRIEYFDDYPDNSSYGTGMRIYNGYLYFSSITTVYRQKLTDGDLVPDSKVETVLTDTQPPGQHDAKPIVFDGKGNMFIPFGASSDCCQVNDRVPFSPGQNPCPYLELRASIYRFDANKINQFQRDGYKYATGLRSVVAMAWDSASDHLYGVAHGRDYLHPDWPLYYSEWESAMLPSEEFLKLEDGSNAGWPYYYYDQMQGKLLLNPEYGGDGKKEGEGKKYQQPLIGFPGHFAPNDLLFYRGNQFPAHYKNGAFIAFHGSTSSAPYPQAGYAVCFVPFKNGEPSGPWEVFADGFAGMDTIVNTSDAKYRPMGLAVGPDGSLYVSDSEKGRIWRIMYRGDKNKFDSTNLEGMAYRKSHAPNLKTPDPIKDNLRKGGVPQVAATYTKYCAICHQANGLGNDRFPPLSGSEWVNGNKDSLINIVLLGLKGTVQVKGKTYDNNMPRLNMLTDEEIAEALTYIRQNFQNTSSTVSSDDVSKARLALDKREVKTKVISKK
ncbi:MAG: PQQ-dependent sugar dehydrogenase [Bacteroidetes bacterium]|nr:PQQ-dependent sugar dehydrogenase [Bacteroidota bacterium]